jgi:hypothetical protein
MRRLRIELFEPSAAWHPDVLPPSLRDSSLPAMCLAIIPSGPQYGHEPGQRRSRPRFQGTPNPSGNLTLRLVGRPTQLPVCVNRPERPVLSPEKPLLVK